MVNIFIKSKKNFFDENFVLIIFFNKNMSIIIKINKGNSVTKKGNLTPVPRPIVNPDNNIYLID